MSWKRITAGGLLAGLIFNVLELGFEPLMGAQMEQFFARLGLPEPGETAMVYLVLTSFVLGILAVWLYAAIEPRYGAGNRTGLIAGTVVWALSCLMPNIVIYAFGLFTPQLFWLATICPLIESILATLAGSWVYGRGASSAAGYAAVRA